MPFTKQKNIDFEIKNDQIILSDDYFNKNSKKFKKITGSRIFSIIDDNSFSSPFKTWCMMVNIYNEPMDSMLANVGSIIEPKIRKWVEQETDYKFKVYNPASVQFDVFKENKIFGGIPDGEPLVNDEVCYTTNLPMLEIKTTSIDSFLFKEENHVFVLQYDENNHPIIKSRGTKKAKWFDQSGNIIIPNEYKFQLGLYCYLRKITYGLFAIAFLEYEDYLYPEKCDVNKRQIELVEFHVNLQEFEKIIKKCENWYNEYIRTGHSPKMNENDKKMVNDLLGE